MLNRDIYDLALRMLAESTVMGEAEDYEERAPYLIAAFCTEMSELDERLRRAAGETTTTYYAVSLPLDLRFPLSDRLFTAAALYLAAMLILDSDEDRADKLYEQYLADTKRISDSVPVPSEDKEEAEGLGPGVSHSIIDKYF